MSEADTTIEVPARDLALFQESLLEEVGSISENASHAARGRGEEQPSEIRRHFDRAGEYLTLYESGLAAEVGESFTFSGPPSVLLEVAQWPLTHYGQSLWNEVDSPTNRINFGEALEQVEPLVFWLKECARLKELSAEAVA